MRAVSVTGCHTHRFRAALPQILCTLRHTFENMANALCSASATEATPPLPAEMQQLSPTVRLDPTNEEIEELGPSAVAFLKELSAPAATSSPLDAATNGAMGGMLCGLTIGGALMPFYSLVKRDAVGWPKAGVVPGRLAQLGFVLGGSSFLGLTLLERLRGKHDVINVLAAGGLGGVVTHKFLANFSIGSPFPKPGNRVPLMPRILPAPGLVASVLSGAVVTSMAWNLQRQTVEEDVPVQAEQSALANSELWSSEVEPWAVDGRGHLALTAAREYAHVAEKSSLRSALRIAGRR